MALIKSVRGCTPQIGKECYLAETATIIGDVSLGEGCSVWFNAVLRGDVNPIYIGNNVNIQDNSTLHCSYQKTIIEIADNVTISHNAIVHGAKIDDYALVGIGAVVLDNCHVGSRSIIAAGAVLLEGTVVEPNSVYAGVPAKKVGEVREERMKDMVERIPGAYRKYASWYK